MSIACNYPVNDHRGAFYTPEYALRYDGEAQFEWWCAVVLGSFGMLPEATARYMVGGILRYNLEYAWTE